MEKGSQRIAAWGGEFGYQKEPAYGCIAVRLDDVSICGEYASVDWLAEKIKARFRASEFEAKQLQYLGMQIAQNGDLSIAMRNKECAKEMELIEMDPDRELQSGEPLTVVEGKNFRSSVGKFTRVARLTRPDLAFGSLTAGRKYGEDQDPDAEYIEEDLAWGVAQDAGPLVWGESEMAHTPGFGECLEGYVR